MLSWALSAALALQAPAAVAPVQSTVQLPAPAAVAVPVVIDPVPRDQVMSLPPELKARVHAFVLAGDPSKAERFRRLIEFVVDDKVGLGMTYDQRATYTVSQAYVVRKANCLTFTLMVIALAEEAGLDAYPQEMGETLSWREIDGTIYRENHINAGVHIGRHRYTVDPAADQVFLPRPPVRVSRDRLLALYYTNVAVDRLQEGRMDAALKDMAVALALDPRNATLWSNAGVIALHNGDLAAAQRDYDRALALDSSDSSALFNMVQLMHRLGDRREGEYRQRLSQVEQRDPLQQFLQALDYERVGNLQRAIASARLAIQLKSDEHRFYAALARMYEHAGDLVHARSALQAAQSLSEGATKAMYRAQREQLRKLGEQARREVDADSVGPSSK